MDNPVPLHIYGGFGAPCGYKTHTLSFARALARIHPVRLRLLGERLEPSSLPVELHGLLERDQDTLPGIALYIGGMHDFPRLPGRFRIGYAVFETTRLPERLLRAFDGLDQVWVPTTWCRAQLIRNGIDPARIRIVPEGVDTDTFSPGPERRADDGAPFRFLCVGKWETRKGQEELIRTFVRTFGPDENVELIIHGHNPFVSGFSLEHALARARAGPGTGSSPVPSCRNRNWSISTAAATPSCCRPAARPGGSRSPRQWPAPCRSSSPRTAGRSISCTRTTPTRFP
jgi:glycosyltransferase involved in cell wall biosynthesis